MRGDGVFYVIKTIYQSFTPSPLIFKMDNIKLDPWQEEVMEAEGDILLCTGRRVGKTYIFSRKACERMVKQRGCHVVVVSLTEDQAQIIISMMLNYLETKYKGMIWKGLKRPTKSKIELKNGSKVTSRAVGNTGNSIRGFEGHVLIIDEASRFPQSAFVAAKPILLTTKGDLWLCSTPFGKQGYFWDSYNNPEFTVFHKNTVEVMTNRELTGNWDEATREKALRRLEREKDEMSKLEYGQEYLGLFIDDLQQFFKQELIRKAMTATRRENIRHKFPYFFGADIGGQGDDPTVYSIFEQLDDGHLIQVENIIEKKNRIFQTTEGIINLNHFYEFKKIGIDSGGLGAGVFDYLFKEDSTKRKIVAMDNSSRPLNFDGKSTKLLKEDMYNNLLRLLETGGIELLDDEDIFHSLSSIQYEYIDDGKGKVRLRIFGRNSHCCEAIIRAAYLAHSSKGLNIWLKSIKL